MAADPGKLQAQSHSKRSKGLQMKSPEKKKRKSSAQGAAFSHLSEFAPPPTPMVDHLVASNPFDDDFGPPARAGGPPGGPGSAGGPFLPSPGGGYGGPGGPMRMGGMPFLGGGAAGAGGSGQPTRRPPFGPPGAGGAGGGHHQMGFGGLPGFGGPGPGGGAGGGGGGGFPPGGPQFNIPPSFSPPGPMHHGPGFNPMLSPGALGGAGGAPHPRFGVPPQQPPGQGGHHFNSPPLPSGGGPRPPHGPLGPMGGLPSGMNSIPSMPGMSSMGGGVGGAGMGGLPGMPPGQFPPHDGPTAQKGAGGLVFPCGFCLSEVNDDQDAILCEASCQKWFHRDCTGMTETAYGLLTRESAAVWACDFCLKTKEIQSVYIREGLGQLVAANDG
nr:PREDICTED: pygopus homolog 2 [Lepisosteus oculatus]